MLKQWFVHQFKVFFKWFSLTLFILLMLAPVVLLELDTWKNILLKIYGVETHVIVSEKHTHIDRIFIPRVGWNEYQYWTISYSLSDHEYGVTKSPEQSAKVSTVGFFKARAEGGRHETNRVDDGTLVRDIEPGSTLRVTYIPGRQGYADVSDNMSSFMQSICSILKVFFVALLGITLVVLVCANGLSTPLKNDPIMKG